MIKQVSDETISQEEPIAVISRFILSFKLIHLDLSTDPATGKTFGINGEAIRNGYC